MNSPARITRYTLLLLGALGLAILSPPFLPSSPQQQTWAQEEKTPEKLAAELIDRAITAVGGKSAYQKLANTRVKYRAQTTHENPGLRVSYEWLEIRRADGAVYTRRRSGQDVELLGTDGKDAWWRPMRSKKAVDATAAMALSMRLEGILQNFLTRYGELGYTAQVVDRRKQRVSFRHKDISPGKPGGLIEIGFAETTGLPQELAMVLPDRSGGKPYRFSIQYFDYKKVDGAQVPHRLVILREEKPIVEAKAEEVEIGVKLGDELFRRP